MKYIILLITFLLTTNLSAQSINNNQKAVQIVDKAIDVLGDSPDGLNLVGSGIIYKLDHYSAPEITKQIPVKEQFGFFDDFQFGYSQTIIEVGEHKYSREIISKKDSVYSWSYYDERFEKSKKSDGLVEVSKSNPYWFLKLARKNTQSLRIVENNETEYVLTATLPDGLTYSLNINKESNLLAKIENITYNAIYGDVPFSTEYKEYKQMNGSFIPRKRLDYQFGFVEREVSYDSIFFLAEPDTSAIFLKWLPLPFLQTLPIKETKKEIFAFETLSENIDLIRFESQNHKSLLVKFPSGLALFEIPQGIELNRQLVKEIKERYPNQGLQHIFLTHHHPDHAGGIKAYAAMPVVVITTEGNNEYFNKLLRTSHYSIPEKTNDEINLTFENVPIDGQKSFGKIVTAYEIGKNTGHSDEHLAYYFPKEKLLWTGDLVFFIQSGDVYPGGMRAKSLYSLIDKHKLDVSKIYTSWPLHNQKDFGTVDFLKQLVETN